jgi:hypothetical protein
MAVADRKSVIIPCNHVWKRVLYAEGVIAEIASILMFYEYVFLSIPQMSRLHGEAKKYFRFTKCGIRKDVEESWL